MKLNLPLMFLQLALIMVQNLATAQGVMQQLSKLLLLPLVSIHMANGKMLPLQLAHKAESKRLIVNIAQPEKLNKFHLWGTNSVLRLNLLVQPAQIVEAEHISA